MKIELEIKNLENIPELTAQDIEKFSEIFGVLISSGGLTGVSGGQTLIHFDANANFMGVQLNYWPWRRKKVASNK